MATDNPVRIDTANHHGYSIIQRRNGDVELWDGAKIVDYFPAEMRRVTWLPWWCPWNAYHSEDQAWRRAIDEMHRRVAAAERAKASPR